jgi:hypothetical protein
MGPVVSRKTRWWYAHATIRFEYRHTVDIAFEQLEEELVEYMLRPMVKSILARKRAKWPDISDAEWEAEWGNVDWREVIDLEDHMWTDIELIRKGALRMLVESRNWDKR